MSVNFFKDKKTKQPDLREVCGNCGNIRGKSEENDSASSSVSCDCTIEPSDRSSHSPSPPPPTPASTSTSFPVPARAQPKEHNCEDDNEKNSVNVVLDARYEIIETIGEGGMGTVYRARDNVLNKDFAVKVLRNDLAADEAAIRRFEQEAVIASGFTHVNILSVYGHGRTIDGAPYIVMDFLEGESLGQILSREGRLEPFRAINICMQICEALAHAHMQGLIHRDLKPSNIMLINNKQSTDMVKVLDFGIAKVMPSANRETQNLTQTGELFGSPSYMSPEQCLGCNLDIRSDVYSLGCLMYEMLTGKPPFAGKNPIQTVVKHLNEEAPPLSKAASKLNAPAGLESIIMRCLEKDAELRYQSMDQLRLDLHLIVTGQVPKQPKKKKPIKPISFTLLFAIPSAFALFASVFIPTMGLLSSYLSYTPPAWVGDISLWLCYILPLSYAILWSTAIGQRWVESRTARSEINKWQRFWHESMLLFLLFGFLSLVCLLLDIYPGSAASSPTAAIILSIAAGILFSFGLIASIGRLLNWALLKISCTSRMVNWLNATYVIGLIVFAIVGRHFIAYNACSLANMLGHPAGYDIAVFIDPNYPDAYYERGLKRLQSDKAGAMDDFAKALSLHPRQPLSNAVLLQQAKIYFRAGDYEKAIDVLSKSIVAFPDGTNYKNTDYRYVNHSLGSIYVARAHCYQKINQLEKALRDYNEVEHHGGSPNCTLTDRGKLYEQLGDNDRALLDYSFSIDKKANYLPAYISRGMLYKKLNEPDKAAVDFKTVLSCFSQAHGPTNGEEYWCLATAERELGMLGKAEDDFASAAAYAPKGKSYESDWAQNWYGYENGFPL
jgi:serine/threonine protein kinase/tetratricopeptide (TPR) repeat protein